MRSARPFGNCAVRWGGFELCAVRWGGFELCAVPCVKHARETHATIVA